jgi:hypothetical protein
VTLAMTMMVRDEADIVESMLEFHLAQGVDVVIVTDNGSLDGTAEILQRYADEGRIVLHHDPVQKKQQGDVVTKMAREAYTEHGADWVINADADEFLRPLDPGLTLREVFERMPVALQSFPVPVTNMVGHPARSGAGIDRLVYRDHRSEAALKAVGVHAQPTPNAIHVGSPDVVVRQGNHYVSITSTGRPPAGLELEVLHLPWRSWAQFEHKVRIAGLSYRANPDLKPSPNHHGMRDFARLEQDRLLPAYLIRQPDPRLLDSDTGEFVRDDSLATALAALPRPTSPAALAADDVIPDDEVAELRAVGLHNLMIELDGQAVLEASKVRWAEERRRLQGALAAKDAELAAFRDRRIVRIADRLGSAVRRG